MVRVGQSYAPIERQTPDAGTMDHNLEGAGVDALYQLVTLFMYP